MFPELRSINNRMGAKHIQKRKSNMRFSTSMAIHCFFSVKHKSLWNVKQMGQGIQEWTKKNLWKTAFKKFEVIWSAFNSNFLKVVFHNFYSVHS